MKKLKSSFTNMVVVLATISIVAGGTLAYLNKITEEPIRQINAKNLAQGIIDVIGDSTLIVVSKDTIFDTQDPTKIAHIIYPTMNKDSVSLGSAVRTSINGFAGEMVVLVGFDQMGSIKGYKVLQTQETPGLGLKADTWFQKGEKGDIIGTNLATKTLKVKADGGDIDAITASTITSRAFLIAVSNAYTIYKEGEKTPVDAQSGASKSNN